MNCKLEFDEKAATLEVESRSEEIPKNARDDFEYFGIEMARWQFNQCAQLLAEKDARIAELEAELASLKKILSEPGEGNRYRLMLVEHDKLKSENDRLANQKSHLTEANKILKAGLTEIVSVASKGDETTTELNCHHLAEDALAEAEKLESGE